MSISEGHTGLSNQASVLCDSAFARHLHSFGGLRSRTPGPPPPAHWLHTTKLGLFCQIKGKNYRRRRRLWIASRTARSRRAPARRSYRSNLNSSGMSRRRASAERSGSPGGIVSLHTSRKELDADSAPSSRGTPRAKHRALPPNLSVGHFQICRVILTKCRERQSHSVAESHCTVRGWQDFSLRKKAGRRQRNCREEQSCKGPLTGITQLSAQGTIKMGRRARYSPLPASRSGSALTLSTGILPCCNRRRELSSRGPRACRMRCET